MEIHKPKPIHSWREFLTELGTIVLGICIALTAEEVLVWNHWRIQVREARAVIASEMTYNLVGAIARARAVECVENRLDSLSEILDEAARTGRLPPVGQIGVPPLHRWESGAWESVVASQTAVHFPPEQLAALAKLYKMVQRAENFNAEEIQAWNELSMMVGPGRALDSSAETLRRALTRARGMARYMATAGRFITTQAASLNLPFSPDELQQLDDVETRPLTGIQPRGDVAATFICEPIGSVPLRYAARASSVNADFAKSLPNFRRTTP
jgi:hypothetical protein